MAGICILGRPRRRPTRICLSARTDHVTTVARFNQPPQVHGPDFPQTCYWRFRQHRSPRVNCHAAFTTRGPVSVIRRFSCADHSIVYHLPGGRVELVGRGNGLTVLTRSSVARHRICANRQAFTLRTCQNRPRTPRPGWDVSRLIGRSPRFHATGYSALWLRQHAVGVISSCQLLWIWHSIGELELRACTPASTPLSPSGATVYMCRVAMARAVGARILVAAVPVTLFINHLSDLRVRL